jgi:hypothetical protein
MSDYSYGRHGKTGRCRVRPRAGSKLAPAIGSQVPLSAPVRPGAVMIGWALLCRAIGVALIGLGVGSFVAMAGSPTVAPIEVEHLLSAVANSGCEFYRNDKWYDSLKASAHLRDKYTALVALGRVVTAIDFIEKAATKSSLSGRPYLIRCAGGEPVPTNQWLREALERYRRCTASPNACVSRLRRDTQEPDHSPSTRPGTEYGQRRDSARDFVRLR